MGNPALKWTAQKFQNLAIDALAPPLDGLHFDNCTFAGCSVGLQSTSPEDRIRIANAKLTNCKAATVHVGPVVFESCEVENLHTTSHLWITGAAFRECSFRGKIGMLIVFEEANPAEPRETPLNRPFIDANREFHAASKWALDISQATFVDLDLRGIAAEHVKTSSKNQIKVDYRKLRALYEQGEFRNQSLLRYIEFCLKQREESQLNFVLTANPAQQNYRQKKELFEAINRKGVLLSG
jgi:hypothetical protein